jgi:ubiquinone/menaquinone biosynthesis C-methylase UbiE
VAALKPNLYLPPACRQGRAKGLLFPLGFMNNGKPSIAYDDPNFDYEVYWSLRQYEHKSEVIALKRILKIIPEKRSILDVGGGFGRLTPTYAPLFKSYALADPSKRMIAEARKLLRRFPKLELKQAFAEELPFKSKSFQVILCVRTIHHLKDCDKAIKEFARVMEPGGYLILEFANKMHFKNMLKAVFLRRGNLFDLEPEDISHKERLAPFLNYHPIFIKNLLNRQEFVILRTYSVSNFRHPLIKKLVPLGFLLKVEAGFSWLSSKFLPLASFGPSIFILAKKA